MSDSTFTEIQGFLTSIEQDSINGVLTSYAAYHEIAVIFDPEKTNHGILIEYFKSVQISSPKIVYSKLWVVPVCYEANYAPDLPNLSDQLGMSTDEIIHKHSQQEYKVHFLGFLPGFMYLGGLDEALHIPRKNKPQLTPQGSVAIGGAQTGIYPQESPGGWHVIGNCPLKFFDPLEDPPCLFQPGDHVKFNPVSYQEYKVMALEIKLDVFDYGQIVRNG